MSIALEIIQFNYDLAECFCLTNLFQKNARVVSIDGYEDVPENDEKSLKKAVVHQPVSVAIEAGGRAFQLYQSVQYYRAFPFAFCCCFVDDDQPCHAIASLAYFVIYFGIFYVYAHFVHLYFFESYPIIYGQIALA